MNSENRRKTYIKSLFLKFCLWNCVQHRGRHYSLIPKGLFGRETALNQAFFKLYKSTFKNKVLT